MAIPLALAVHVIILNLIPTHWPVVVIVLALTANLISFVVVVSFILTRA